MSDSANALRCGKQLASHESHFRVAEAWEQPPGIILALFVCFDFGNQQLSWGLTTAAAYWIFMKRPSSLSATDVHGP